MADKGKLTVERTALCGTPCNIVCWSRPLDQCFGCATSGRFRSWVLKLNAAAFSLHLTLFVVLLWIVLTMEREFPALPLTEKVGVWETFEPNATEHECAWSDQCKTPTLKPVPITTSDGDKWLIYDSETSYGELSLTALVLSFSALSFLFQAARPFIGWGDNDYLESVARRVNYLRWLEYSFSASVMIVCVALVVGVRSYSNIVMYFTSTFATQFCGLVAELILEKDPDNGYENERGETFFLPAFLIVASGWVLQIGVFISLFASFTLSVEKAGDLGGQEPPWWVWLIVIGMAVLFSSFGVVNLVDLVHRCYFDNDRGNEFCGLKKDRCCCCKASDGIELSYIVLSLTAKALLALLVATQLFIAPQ